MNALTGESRLPGYVSLFASTGTLLCCALPSLFVLVGLGATVASVISALPWLAELSRHRAWVFGISGALIAGNAWYLFRVVPRLLLRKAVCAPGEESTCATASRFSRIVLMVSLGVYLVGFFAAYVLGPILMVMDGSS